MSPTSTDLPLNENDDVRAATWRPSICVSALMISSEIPSLKYSFSGSGLMLAKGSTAIDGGSAAGLRDTCSSAALTSTIAGNRSAGCFARHRRTMRSNAGGV